MVDGDTTTIPRGLEQDVPAAHREPRRPPRTTWNGRFALQKLSEHVNCPWTSAVARSRMSAVHPARARRGCVVVSAVSTMESVRPRRTFFALKRNSRLVALDDGGPL